ncbi:MAG: hypothetical protein ACI4TM_06895, partial [Candidatus Cryptobacteroides sp.]
MKRPPAVACQSHKLAVVDYSTRKNLIVASTTMNVSFHSFLSGFSKAFRRFPAAAFFFVLLTIFAIYELYDDDTVHFLMLYYPATAGMLNIVLRLLAESRKNDNRRLSNYLIDATVNVLWFAAALTFKDYFSLDIAWTISA